MLKQFMLQRRDPARGTNAVAFGVIFPSGRIAVEWTAFKNALGLYTSIDQVMQLHGRDTEVKWLDPSIVWVADGEDET